MRVIGGQFRSRVLCAPPGQGTRPTSDRLRETLFNVLASRVEGAQFADLYAGSGAVGIEAMSRGAASCLLVERAPAALQALRKNVAALALRGVTVDTRPVGRALAELARKRTCFDLVFLDPPYEAHDEYAATLTLLAKHHASLLGPDALVVAEHARRATLPQRFGELVRGRLLEQGDAALSFYRVELTEFAPGL